MTEKMLEREKYHETLREEALESDDGGDLEVIDDVEDEPSDEPEVGRTPSDEDASPPLRQSKLDAASKEKGKGKGKAKADGTPPPILGDSPSETTAGKRKRPPMDPFAGLCPFSPPQISLLSQPILSFFTGYGDGQDTRSPGAPADTSSATRSGTKVRRIHAEDSNADAADAPSATNTPSGGEDKAKRSRKRSKKKAVS
jgi:hypothetical protein